MLEQVFGSTNSKSHFIVCVVLLSLISGCSSPQPISPSLTTTSPPPTLMLVPIASTPIPPLSFSTPTCPITDPQVEFSPPETNSEIADRVLGFLNTLGDPQQIVSYYAQFQLKTLDIRTVDMNDDGLEEIVIAGALPLEFNASDNGVIFILECKHESYEIVKQFDFQSIASAEVLRTERLLVGHPQQVII